MANIIEISKFSKYGKVDVVVLGNTEESYCAYETKNLILNALCYSL
jgi:hypothetical protein